MFQEGRVAAAAAAAAVMNSLMYNCTIAGNIAGTLLAETHVLSKGCHCNLTLACFSGVACTCAVAAGLKHTLDTC